MVIYITMHNFWLGRSEVGGRCNVLTDSNIISGQIQGIFIQNQLVTKYGINTKDRILLRI